MNTTTAAQVIAKNLAALPHPDGTPRQLPGFNAQLLPEALQQQINQTATDIGTAIIYLLETSGYIITTPEEQRQPTQTEPAPVANLHCTICDTRLMQINLTNPQHVGTNGPALLKALRARNVDCPHA